MDSKEFQDYAMCMVLSSQLYAWSHHYIITELPGDERLKRTLIAQINSSMMDSKGNPRPFDEVEMSVRLADQIEYVKSTATRHLAELEASVPAKV